APSLLAGSSPRFEILPRWRFSFFVESPSRWAILAPMSARRVLVVDDEPLILDIVRYFLEQGGYEVEAVEGGEKALAAAKKKPFDIAVLDIVLIGDSG